MARLLILALLIACVYGYFTKKKGLSVKQLRLRLAFMGVLGLAIFLAATGRMHWIGLALAAMLPLLRTLMIFLVHNFPLLHSLARRYGLFQNGIFGAAGMNKANNRSTVTSAVLKMTLDHQSGDLDGEVLLGDFSGKKLSELTELQLQSLLVFCNSSDQESVDLLQAYIERRFGEQWQGERQNQHGDGVENGSANAGFADYMDENEALAILGLETGADKKAVIDAHRKLMQKLHPDRGGNDYLAAKINQAKEYLLKGNAKNGV